MAEILNRRKDLDRVWVNSSLQARLVMVHAVFSRITLMLLKIYRDQTMEEFKWSTTTEKTLMMMNLIKMKALTQMNTSSSRKKSSRCSHPSSRCRSYIPGQKASYRKDRALHRFKNKTRLKLLKMRKNLLLRRISGLLIKTLLSRCFTKVSIQTVRTEVLRYWFRQRTISWL